jgi:hypothetical protein
MTLLENDPKAQSIRDRIKSLPTISSPMEWIFTRTAVTERENPCHIVMVMGGKPTSMLPKQYRYSALVPTLLDILEVLDKSITAVEDKKPSILAIDVKYAVEPLNTFLRSTHISVVFYARPSVEQLTNNVRTTANVRSTHIRPCCEVCRREAFEIEGLEKLYQCSRCKRQYYCSKEHQRAHWKIHKMYCMNFS